MTAPAVPARSRTPGQFFPFHSSENWLKPDLADRLLAYANENEAQFKPGAVLHDGNPTVDPAYRIGSVLSSLGEFEAPLRDAALALKPYLETAFGIPAFPVKRLEMELAAHGDGAHFKRHIDTFVVVNRAPATRVLTLVLYLTRRPKAFSGGALRMYALGSSHTRDVEPMHNLLVAFPSITPHSVERIDCPGIEFASSRFAVNIWIHR
jgi:SM-20-related protein